MPDDLEPADLDSKVWYHLTEGRIDHDYDSDFKGTFVEDSKGTLIGGDASDGIVWQFMPVGNGKEGRYAVRSSDHNLSKQLSVCWTDDEIDGYHTRPCMAASDGSERQKWDIADWGDGTFRFINVKNGSDFYMDVHPGNPAYMSKQRGEIDSQHWLMTSVKDINDEAYQTVFSNPTPSASGSDAPKSTGDPAGDGSGSSNGLSAGAAAGIGVGVGLLLIIIAVAGFLLWRRRRRQNLSATDVPVAESHGGEYDLVSKSTPGPPSHDWSTPPPPQEMATERSFQELDSREMGLQYTQVQPYAELDSQPVDRSHSPR